LLILSRSINKHDRHRPFLSPICWFVKKNFLWNAWTNESKLCRKHLWKVLYKIAHLDPIRWQTWPSQAKEKIKMWKVNGLKRRQTPSDGKSQIFAKVTKFQQIYFRFVNSRRIIAGLLRFVNFHTTLFQNVLYWCLELTCHNIGNWFFEDFILCGPI
jgi:hypothetical protein